ncbi:hypothetical protein [Hominifimenecus sp. rT4P-3]|uniref:hypothetical protein n=1 Tax=Hominifimenecus sp. rT4P-3 TaxID=3242979 RepID=UPI003DA5C29A
MRRKPTKLGVLALMLLIITISLATLGVLTMSTAQADLRLAERYGQMSRQQYQREQAGQIFLEEVQEALESGGDIAGLEGVTQNGDIYEKTFTAGNAVLRVGLRTNGHGGYEIVSWETEPQWSPTGPENKLWGG